MFQNTLFLVCIGPYGLKNVSKGSSFLAYIMLKLASSEFELTDLNFKKQTSHLFW